MSTIWQSIQRFQAQERAREDHERQFVGPRCPPRFIFPPAFANLPGATDWMKRQRSAGHMLPVVVERIGVQQ